MAICATNAQMAISVLVGGMTQKDSATTAEAEVFLREALLVSTSHCHITACLDMNGLTLWLPRLVSHSDTHSLTHSLTHSPSEAPIHPLTRSLSYPPLLWSA